MFGVGTASSDLSGLRVKVMSEGWSFLLRRIDLRSDPGFSRYHGKNVQAGEIIRFLPNWRSLQWTRVPDNLLSCSESCAQNREYMVNVQAGSPSAMRHEDVIAVFLRFMSQAET
ncbi:MAG: hypothetical protein M0015_13755 [Betaproteobacteria bacterium]|nr:hypothetical protein [Betaproteobacteria bacterium]